MLVHRTVFMTLLIFIILWKSSVWAVPETTTIQGSIEAPSGGPVLGTLDYIISFHTDAVGGNELASVTGEVSISKAGRFSIDTVLPPVVLSATDVWYELAIDVGEDGLDTSDRFPERVRIHSVPFALQSANSEHAAFADSANTADSATMAMSLSGSLSNPGDSIQLGDDVFLQVASDGIVELLADGQRMRLARQKWFGPRSILDNISPDGTNASQPRIALNDNGDALIIWSQSDGSFFQTFRSENRNGSWSDPAIISDNFSPDGQDTHSPKVALNQSGDAVIVWSQSDGAFLQIFRSEHRDGLWTDPTGLSDNISPDSSDADAPQVALNDSGDAVIVWQQPDLSLNQKYRIFRSEYRNGSWTDPSNIFDHFSPGGQDAAFPQVALNNNGDAVIVWYQSDGANNQIFRSEYQNGSWIDPSGLLDNISPDGQDSVEPQVALNDNGDAIIAWRQSDGANEQIFRSERRDGSWTDPVNLLDNISPSGQNAISPQVAMNNNGQAIIVWFQNDGANSQVFRSEYRNGSWTDPSGLSDNISPDGQDAGLHRVAMNDDGDAVIAWVQSDGTNNQIFRSHYRSGSWNDPTDLSDHINPDGQTLNSPDVALNSNGDAVIVWQQSDGEKSQIFRSEYRFGF